MIVEKFASLPSFIDYQGVNFELALVVNGRSDDVRLVYVINYAEAESPHRELIANSMCWENPFAGGRLQGFLYLYENIATDEDLIAAVEDCETFLNKHKLNIQP